MIDWLGQAMRSIAERTAVFRRLARGRVASSAFIFFLVVVTASLQPAYAADMPSEDAQDVLVRTTLMTFNDANMTGNYAVMLAKSSQQFQTQVTPEKLAAALEAFRTNKLFFETVVGEDYDSTEKPVIDKEGVLNLGGVLKSDEIQVTYKLRFVQNGSAWKLLGFNVDAKKL
jgi:hypothetical protein